MPEPTQQPDANEIERLRLANSQLTEKSKTRKARIAELEGIISERDTALAAAQAQLKQITVDAPLRSMATELSIAPDLWIEQFNKSMKLEMIEGKLTIIGVADGNPIDVPFEKNALRAYLIDEKNPNAKTFQAIVVASRASGAASQVTQRAEKKVAKPDFQFGFK